MESYQTVYHKLKKIVYNIISPHILNSINKYKNDKFIISPINSKAFELLVDNNLFINDYNDIPFNKLELGLYYHNPLLFELNDIENFIKSITIDESHLVPLFFNINIYEPDLYTLEMLKEDTLIHSNIFNLSDITVLKQSDKYYKIIFIHRNINIVLFKISKKIHKYDIIKFTELVDNLQCINYLELLSQLQTNTNKNKKMIDILSEKEDLHTKSQENDLNSLENVNTNTYFNTIPEFLLINSMLMDNIECNNLLQEDVQLSTQTSINSLDNLFNNTIINTELLISNCNVDINLENHQDDISSIFNYDVIKSNLYKSFIFLLKNSNIRNLLHYYSNNGYKYINSYLFGKIEPISYTIPFITNYIIDYIQNREINIVDKSFILWRYTYPSLYGQIISYELNEYDIIKFPGFTSATYEDINNYSIQKFLSYFTPMIIFKIIITPTQSNYSKFIFIESTSEYPYEREVLFIPSTMFRIINKKYFTFHIKNNKYVQKLVYTLEIVNDNCSSSFYTKQKNVKLINFLDIKNINSFYF